jgi:pimeloyl-ACP methyl ester carboxylesterase
MNMAEANLSQGKIYYEVHGKGPPLIGLHYGASSSRVWKEHAPSFAKEFTFICYDRLGHGKSEGRLSYGKRHFEDRAKELGELINHLGLESVSLCGMCEGGAVALKFGSTFPDIADALILQSVGYYATDETIAQCEQYFLPWLEIEDDLRRQFVGHHGETYAEQKWETIRALKPYVWDPDYDIRSSFPKIMAPTLIIGGDRDPFFGLEHPIAAYKGIKNAELCIIPKAGHFLSEESPALFAHVVVDFLQRHC